MVRHVGQIACGAAFETVVTFTACVGWPESDGCYPSVRVERRALRGGETVTVEC